MSKYFVTNGDKYLRKNKQGEYYLANKEDATAWDTRKQALNALNTGIGKQYKKGFYIEKPGKAEDPETELERFIEADTTNFDRWLADIGDLKHFANTINTKIPDLREKLSEVNKEIGDVLHYIEFGKLNASQGWAASEMIKIARQRRRKIKDLLYIAEKIKRGKKVDIPEYESVQIAIDNLNNRHYNPRTLNVIFEERCNIHC